MHWIAWTGRYSCRLSSNSPLQHRSVLELVLYYEMSYAEVAQVLECPVGTVKSRLSYARRQMVALISLKTWRREGI